MMETRSARMFALRLALLCAAARALGPAHRLPSLERDAGFMGLALDEARRAAAAGEVPVGAVVVDDATGAVVAAAGNAIEATQDASAHAELLALRRAAAARGNWRLANCTLYSTLEPCVLCMSACYAFRVGRVVYGAPDHRLGAAESWLNMAELGHPFHALAVDGGVREPEAADAMRSFFRARRKEPKWQPP
jgi:tRNA(adenine34) deaminase